MEAEEDTEKLFTKNKKDKGLELNTDQLTDTYEKQKEKLKIDKMRKNRERMIRDLGDKLADEIDEGSA